MIAVDEIPDCPDDDEPLVAEVPRDLYAKWYYAKQKAAAWDSEAKRLRGEIEERLGEAIVGLIDGRPVVRWGWRQTRRLDQKALKADHPELVEKYTRPTEERRFEPVEQAA